MYWGGWEESVGVAGATEKLPQNAGRARDMMCKRFKVTERLKITFLITARAPVIGFGSYEDPVEPKPCLKGLCYSQVRLHKKNMGFKEFGGVIQPENIQPGLLLIPKRGLLLIPKRLCCLLFDCIRLPLRMRKEAFLIAPIDVGTLLKHSPGTISWR